MTKEHKDIMATIVKLFKDNFKIQEQDSVPAEQSLFKGIVYGKYRKKYYS